MEMEKKRARSRIRTAKWPLLASMELRAPPGFYRNLHGMAVREVGRQPWIIYDVMRTKDGVSPVSASVAAGSLALFSVIYISLLVLFIYFARRIIIKGPDMSSTPELGNHQDDK